MKKTQLTLTQRRDFGGSYIDSFSHSKMFNSYTPHNFGVKMGKTFSQVIGDHLVNKRFTHMTIAENNVYMLPGGVDDYCWYVGADSETEFRFTELLVPANSQPGKGKLPFKIACDKDWLHEPAVIKLGGHGLPLLRVLGHGVRRSANSFEYEVMIQDGDPNVFIPVSELQPDKTFTRVASLVSDELNMKFAPDEYGDMYKLQSWVSNYANKAEFTDKALRLEASGKKGEYSLNGSKQSGAMISSGYTYQVDLKDKSTGNMISKGAFITAVEARLEERTHMDREMMMEFGRLDKTVDPDSGRIIKAAPGWQQLVQDGYYMEHNGSLSLDQLFNFLNNIFLTRRSFKNRKIKLSGGEAAIRWLSRLIFQEYSSIVTVDSHFVQKNSTPTGVHSNELQYGKLLRAAA